MPPKDDPTLICSTLSQEFFQNFLFFSDDFSRISGGVEIWNNRLTGTVIIRSVPFRTKLLFSQAALIIPHWRDNQ